MAASGSSGSRAPAGLHRRLLRPLRWAVGLVLAYLLACTLLLVAYRWVSPPVTTVMIQRFVEHAADGQPYRLAYAPVGAEAMSPAIRYAAVASEDARFYDHTGFDLVEIRNAREEAARGGGMRGASTITQQLVKNLFLTTHRSWVRKGAEVPLTLLAELIVPKERILTLYLNVVEFDEAVFGVEAAARHYYGVSADKLSRNRAARLVAVLPAPRTRAPQHMSRTAARIQRRMSQMGW